MAQGAVLGLDIGTRMIKYCEARPGREGPELLSWGACPTPPNTISNGVIVDPATLGAALRELLSTGGARTRRVNCAVTSQSSLVVRPIEVPRMSEAELAETMRWEVERYIPFAASEVIVDYKPLVAIDQLPPDAQNMEILLAAGQEDMINAYVETLSAARLEPLSLDVEPLSACRALIDINADQGAYDKVIALVNIGAGTTDISIIRNGTLAFCRPVPIAGDSLTNAVSEGLGREFEEAEKLKVEEGMILFDPALYRPALRPRETAAEPKPPTMAGLQVAPAPSEEFSDRPVFDLGEEIGPAPAPPSASAPPPVPTAQTVGDTMGRRVFEALAPTLAELVTEVRRSLDFYSTRFPQARVEKVLVFGGTARLSHFDLFLSNELGFPVEVADPIGRFHIAAPGGLSEELRSLSPMLPISVGMALRDMLE